MKLEHQQTAKRNKVKDLFDVAKEINKDYESIFHCCNRHYIAPCPDMP